MGVTLKNCASDVASILDGQTLGGVLLALNGNLFSAPLLIPPTSLAVECINTGGSPPEPYVRTTDSAIMRGDVQLLIHSEPGTDGFTQGETLARAVLGYLQQYVMTGYVSLLAQESSPSWLGPDPETQRNSWSINLEAVYSA